MILRYTLLGLMLSILACTPTPSDQKQDVSTQQSGPVGGPCEGCEATIQYAPGPLPAVDTLPGFEETGQKLMVSGTVYQKDGKTPASEIILYVYHTDQEGIYMPAAGATGWARRHGYIRGWLKTDESGHYAFYTLRPAAYPEGNEEEHIHIMIKEPDKIAYYIDSFVFPDDPLLTEEVKRQKKNRGGSGIMHLRQEGDLLIAERDIILGANIPNYP